MEFMAPIKTIETYGGMGRIAIVPTFVAQKLRDMQADNKCADPNNPSKDELAETHKIVCNEFLVALILSGANRECYGLLRNELANQYGFGNNLYPKTVDQCLTMMNQRMDSTPARQQHGPQQQQHSLPNIKQEEEALVFAQGSNEKAINKPKEDGTSSKSSSLLGSVARGKKITKIICGVCGKVGHMSSVRPRLKPPPEQIHAMATGHDDASESSENESVLILTQFNEALLTQPSHQF